MSPDDLILISVDDHICEPADMFERHVPSRYADAAPRVVTDEQGVQQWWYGDVKGRNLGLNAVAGKPPEYYHIDPSSYDEMRPGCWDVHERVRDMNAGGQLAAMCFPNWTGFSGQVLNDGPDADTNEVMIRAYNDWALEEWTGAYPERFIPIGILPYFDPERAAAEVHRLADLGVHAVNFPEEPSYLKLPSFHSDHWNPVWAACCERGTIVCMHIGSAYQRSIPSPGAPPSTSVSIIGISPAYTLNELVWSSLWHRFPDLTIALSEGGIGWIPYMLQRMDHVHAQVDAVECKRLVPRGLSPVHLVQFRLVEQQVSEMVLDPERAIQALKYPRRLHVHEPPPRLLVVSHLIHDLLIRIHIVGIAQR